MLVACRCAYLVYMAHFFVCILCVVHFLCCTSTCMRLSYLLVLTWFALSMHVQSMHGQCMLNAWSMHAQCMLNACSMHVQCMVHACSMHAQCILNACSMHSHKYIMINQNKHCRYWHFELNKQRCLNPCFSAILYSAAKKVVIQEDCMYVSFLDTWFHWFPV